MAKKINAARLPVCSQYLRRAVKLGMPTLWNRVEDCAGVIEVPFGTFSTYHSGYSQDPTPVWNCYEKVLSVLREENVTLDETMAIPDDQQIYLDRGMTLVARLTAAYRDGCDRRYWSGEKECAEFLRETSERSLEIYLALTEQDRMTEKLECLLRTAILEVEEAACLIARVVARTRDCPSGPETGTPAHANNGEAATAPGIEVMLGPEITEDIPGALERETAELMRDLETHLDRLLRNDDPEKRNAAFQRLSNPLDRLHAMMRALEKVCPARFLVELAEQRRLMKQIKS